MEIVKLSEVGVEEAARKAVAVLCTGGIVLYPSDTLYGLGADALSDVAVERVRFLKGRDDEKPIHALAADIGMVERFANVPDMARRLAAELPAGKVSFVVPKKAGLDTGIAHSITSIGFRIPDHSFCRGMLTAFGSLVTATSANITGLPPQATPAAILAQFGPAVMHIDLVIDGGDVPSSVPSTVVDFSVGPHPVILREAAVPAADVWEVLRDFDAAHG